MENIYYNIKLYREVDNKVRYYSFKIYPTLFGEYLLIREYGGVKNKSATRVMKQYYSDLKDAVGAGKQLYEKKYKKGYRVLNKLSRVEL